MSEGRHQELLLRSCKEGFLNKSSGRNESRDAFADDDDNFTDDDASPGRVVCRKLRNAELQRH